MSPVMYDFPNSTYFLKTTVTERLSKENIFILFFKSYSTLLSMTLFLKKFFININYTRHVILSITGGFEVWKWVQLRKGKEGKKEMDHLRMTRKFLDVVIKKTSKQ